MTVFQRKPGGSYYVRKTIHGTEIFQSLKTRNKSVAMDRARAIVEKAQNRQFEPVMATRSRSGIATVGEVLDVYRQAAAARGLRPATVAGNISKLRLVLTPAHGDSDDVRLTELSRKTVAAYVDSSRPMQAGPDKQAAWRRSVRSTLRQARSVFSAWAMGIYEDQGLQIPQKSMHSFLKAEGVASKGAVFQYERPRQEQVDLVLSGAAQLQRDRSDLYPVFLLTYSLAMRAREAAWARVEWLREEAHGWSMQIPISAEFETKSGKARSVPVHPEVAESLLAAAASNATGYFLAGSSATARENLVKREFSDWMHAIGWERRKCAHELRKLMGCRWFTEQGAEIAQALLGHRSIATTCQYYARYARPVDALAPDW